MTTATSSGQVVEVSKVRTVHVRSGPRSPVLVDDGDRLLRAHAGGVLRLGSQLGVGMLVEDVQEVVVSYFEELRRSIHTERVALTPAKVDDDPHVPPLTPWCEREMECLDASQDVRGRVVEPASVGRAMMLLRDPDVVEPSEHPFDGDPALVSHEWRAGTRVDPTAESQVFARSGGRHRTARGTRTVGRRDPQQAAAASADCRPGSSHRRGLSSAAPSGSSS